MKLKIQVGMIIILVFLITPIKVNGHVCDDEYSTILEPYKEELDYAFWGLCENLKIIVEWTSNSSEIVANFLHCHDLTSFLYSNHTYLSFKKSDTSGYFNSTTGNNDCLLFHNYDFSYVSLYFSLTHKNIVSVPFSSLFIIVMTITVSTIILYLRKKKSTWYVTNKKS